MIFQRTGLGLAMAVSITGCVSYTPESYNVSPSNQIKLQKWKGGEFSVGKFINKRGDKTSFLCRDVGLIKLPDEQTYANYIRDAFIKELKESGIYSESSDRMLTGVINHIEYKSDAGDWGSSLSSGAWDISLTLVSSDGGSMKVSKEYTFNTNWNARAACEKSAQAFTPAVQHLINKVVSSSEFAGLLK